MGIPLQPCRKINVYSYYFKGKRKISLLASSNNINSTGFSMDEIFDNMGGGRNMSVYYSDNGSFGIGNMRFGGGQGITRSDMIGLNYSDEWIKNLDTNGSYFFTDSNSKNENRTKQTTFLPTENFSTASKSKTNSDSFGHNLNFEFEYKIDSTATINFSPKINISNYRNNSDYISTSSDENDELLNKNTSKTFDEGDAKSFENSINYSKSFKKKGRYFSMTFNNENSKSEVNSLNKSETIFYKGTDPNIFRDQNSTNKNIDDMYFSEMEYSEPLKDSIKVKIGLDYRWKNTSEDVNTYDFNQSSQSYSDLNEGLTKYQTSNTKTLRAKAGFSINKKKYSFNLNAGPSITQFDNHALYLGLETDLNKSYVLPYVQASGSYKIGKSKSIWTSYDYNVEFPSANQVLPILDLSNPVNTTIGNPDLNPNKNHSGYFSFNNYDYASRSGYSIYSGGSYYDSQVVSSTVYEVNSTSTTTFKNVSGTYSTWAGLNWNKSIKKEAHTYKYGFGFWANYGLSKGFTNGELFDANTLSFSPKVNFTYEYGELFTLNPTYKFSFNDTKYSNYTISSASNVVHEFKIQSTNYWPKNWVFGNDFGYTYNSNIADDFKKDFYLWNTSLAYSFYNKKWTAKVKVYDVLNQNQSATRTITPNSIQDEENTVLKRYLMFSLSYKLQKFGAKEKPSENHIIIF